MGHLTEFADQISGRQILVNGPTRSDHRNQYNMRMVYKIIINHQSQEISYNMPLMDEDILGSDDVTKWPASDQYELKIIHVIMLSIHE